MAREQKSAILAMAFLTALMLYLLLFSYSLLIPLVVEEMEISYAEAGLAFSACILAIALLRVP